jgi:hypothetical protein
VTAAVLLSAKLLPEEKGHEVAWRDLSAQVGPVTILGSQQRLIRKPSSLARFLDAAKAKGRPPTVDFSSRQLLFVSPGPRSSTGYSIVILSAREQGGKITVRVKERWPRVGEHVEARVTYPYRLLSLPAGKDVYVDWVGR